MPLTLSDMRALAALAREAGTLILRIRAEHDARQRDMEKTDKDDGSPVTRADREAQAHIIAGITRLGLEAPIVAEEDVPSSVVTSGRYYLIDPLDGTRAFVAGSDDFTVNIGLIEGGVPVAGVIHAPVLDETTYATDGAAYMTVRAGHEEKITTRLPKGDTVDVIVNRTEDWSGRLRRFLDDYKVGELHRRSSAHKIALVAQGKFDLYPRFGPTYEWDIAAGDAIVRAAGGSLTQIDGAPMPYGKAGFKNPPFVVRGRRA